MVIFHLYNMKTIYTAEQLKSIYGEPKSLPAQQNVQTKQEGDTGLAGVATGVAKGIASTVKGAGQLGETIGNALLPKSMETPSVYSEQALKQDASQGGAMGKLLNENNLKANSTAESIGKGAEQIAEFAIPSTKLAKVSKGANLAKTAASRALTSGTVASVQAGDVGKEAGVAAGLEVALPVAGKLVVQPIKRLLGRVLKGTGVALSGASGTQLDNIINNTDDAIKAGKELKAKGSDALLEQNVKTIFNGATKIRKDAGSAYAKGLDALEQTDIKPEIFRARTQGVLDNYQVSLDGGERVLQNVEFTDPKNLQKASNLIDKLANVELNGKALRKLSNEIDTSAFKTTGTDAERLSYNQFIQDLSKSVKGAIDDSTPKLKEINKAYSQEVQLVDAIEKELGNIDFKNLSEVVAASKKLEGLFNKSGLAPKVIDDFLTKIGAGNLKTSEAVRQISTKELTSNTIGTQPLEVLRNISSAIVTPKMVKNIALVMKISDTKVSQLLKKLDPTARAILIKTLTSED